MMNTQYNLNVLSEAVSSVINKRRVKYALFLTFKFDPCFFEEEIFPLLFDESFSSEPRIKIAQLENSIRSINQIEVFYDVHGLVQEAQTARLDYKRIGIRRKTGYFHPKNIFLIVEDKDENGDPSESLIVVTASANLTRAGWWENVEAAQIEEIKAGSKTSFRDDLRYFLKEIKKEDRTNDSHDALNYIRKFLSRTIQYKVRSINEYFLPRIYFGSTPFPDFLSEFAQAMGSFNLEIISPYFDKDNSASVIIKLIEELQPDETRIYLPIDRDGTVMCTEELYKKVQQLDNVNWGEMPSELVKRTDRQNDETIRTVHAKVYRLWNPKKKRELLFVGSVNLTTPAHSRFTAGNAESGILTDNPKKQEPAWWLEPQKKKFSLFKKNTDDPEESTPELSGLSIKFNWQDKTGSYFWDENPVPGTIPCSAYSDTRLLFTVTRSEQGKWIGIGRDESAFLCESLECSSFVLVKTDNGKQQRILVREENMARKPSLIEQLTVEEILKYWSLLSPEQRNSFLKDKIAEQKKILEYLPQKKEDKAPESFFDKFAGIFHAFGKLKAHIMKAAADDAQNEMYYRLFGNKHDSLPGLLNTVKAGNSQDRVNSYLIFLCAEQLMEKFMRDETIGTFIDRHKKEKKELDILFKYREELKSGFTFDTPEEREEFFGWFETQFLKDVPVKNREE